MTYRYIYGINFGRSFGVRFKTLQIKFPSLFVPPIKGLGTFCTTQNTMSTD